MSVSLDRRSFMAYFAGVGLGSTLFPGVLWAKLAAGAEITVDTIANAEEVAGLHFDPQERELMLDGLKQQEQRIEALHKISLANSVSPAIKYDPVLRCVISLTEDRALRQAAAADAEIKRGRYRGPLHGIPWGAKDLLAVRGYKTTWGAGPFRNQVIDTDATVVQRLDAAGAVLVAKLTLGELAQGDIWIDATTKNPWKVDQGSSGSSAGPASATAGGLVGFSIGSETLGSISSPSTRCGTTGLRPTFGRVPRTGAMALSWTMDKLGPICRTVEDCAIVLDAIYGPDGQDNSVIAAPYHWEATQNVSAIRVGWLQADFEDNEVPKDEKPEQR